MQAEFNRYKDSYARNGKHKYRLLSVSDFCKSLLSPFQLSHSLPALRKPPRRPMPLPARIPPPSADASPRSDACGGVAAQGILGGGCPSHHRSEDRLTSSAHCSPISAHLPPTCSPLAAHLPPTCRLIGRSHRRADRARRLGSHGATSKCSGIPCVVII